MHRVAKQADQQQDDQNLQPNRAQLPGRREDELAPPIDLREKHQDGQKNHPGRGARDIQLHQARHDIPGEN